MPNFQFFISQWLLALIWVLAFSQPRASAQISIIRPSVTTNNFLAKVSPNASGNLTLSTAESKITVASATNAPWTLEAGSFLGQDNVKNHVMSWGYNIGNVDTNDIIFKLELETRWKDGGVQYNEFYVQRNDPDGRSYRPIMLQQSRSGASNMLWKIRGDTSFHGTGEQTNTDNAILNIGEDGKVMIGPGNVTYNVGRLEVAETNYNAAALILTGNALGGLGFDASIGMAAINGAANRTNYIQFGLDAESAGVGSEQGNFVVATRDGPILTNRFTILYNGNVGIGTTNNPQSKLIVQDASRAAADNFNGSFSIVVSNTPVQRLTMGYDNGSGNGRGWIQALHEGSAWTPLLLNLNGGNVGIGTNAPADRFHVYGNARVENGYIEGTEISEPAAPATDHGRLYFRDNGSGKSQLVVRFPTGAIQVLATEP